MTVTPEREQTDALDRVGHSFKGAMAALRRFAGARPTAQGR